MKELFNNTIFLTVLSGVLVYILSQLFLELIVNPQKEYKGIKHKIIYTMKLYCCYYHNPYNLLDEKRNIREKEEYDFASKEMRKVGAELAAYIGTIPQIRLKKRKKLNEVLDSIIGISNGFYIVSEDYDVIKDNKECEKIINKALDEKSLIIKLKNITGENMKKNNLLILSILFFMIQFLNRWFSDQMFDKIFLLYCLINFLLFVLFLILLIFVIKNVIKNKSTVNIVSLIFLVTTILLTIFFPYRQIKTKLELELFENDRNKIIEMVKNNKISPDENNNAKLPSNYKKLSTSGEIHIYQNDNNGMVIGFWIFRGMMSSSTELIYSTDGEKLICENKSCNSIVSINRLKENWYYVVREY